MTWMLTASGHVDDSPEWQRLEQKLLDELRAVLSRPEFGAVASRFRGIHLASSVVHEPVLPAAVVEDGTGQAVAVAAFTSGVKRGPGRPRTVGV